MLNKQSLKSKQRDYISWSQYSLYKKSPEEYESRYLVGEEGYATPEMEFGRNFAEGLDKGSDDIEIEAARLVMPDYPKKEYEITTIYKGTKMKGVLDLFDPRKKKCGEVKTGVRYNQNLADKLGQLKFYNLLCLAKFGMMLKEINLCWFETKNDGEEIRLTGKHRVFEVRHRISDLLLFFSDVKKINNQIMELRKKYGQLHYKNNK